MSRTFVRVLLGIVIALVVLIGSAALLVWWKLSTLKERLVQELGKSLDAQVQIASIDFDAWKGELHMAGISLVNQNASAPWDKADLSQATLLFHPSEILSPSLPVTVVVTGWNVVFHSRAGTSEASFTAALPESAPGESHGWVQVTKVSAKDGSAEIDFSPDRKVFFHDVAFEAENNGAGIWTTQAQIGSLLAGELKSGPSSIELRVEPGKISFSSLRMQVDSGMLTGDGDVALNGSHVANVTLKAIDIPIAMLVSVDWQMKLSGLVSGDVRYQGDDLGGNAKGSLAVNHGKFNVLPWVGKLTSMVGLQDITDVEVDKESADFAWKDHLLHLTNIDIRKNDVTRIAGQIDVDGKGVVDGRLKLGLPSAVTSKWPQMQTQVFPTQQDNFNYADVHLTGTSDHLEEDLTTRLLTAGLGQGGDILNQAEKKAGDLYNSIFGK